MMTNRDDLDLGDLEIESDVPVPSSGKKTLRQSRTREKRRSRAQDTWDANDVHAMESKPWTRPVSLEAPPARPGFKQRWIRTAMQGQPDEANAMRRLREGWKPRPADSIPADFPVPTIQHGEWAGCLGVEGMVLCEMPDGMVEKRNQYFRAKTDKITTSVDEELRAQSDPRMAITQERSSKVVREVKVAPDE